MSLQENDGRGARRGEAKKESHGRVRGTHQKEEGSYRLMRDKPTRGGESADLCVSEAALLNSPQERLPPLWLW